MTILDTIIEQKRKEVEILKSEFKIKDFEKSPLFSVIISISIRFNILP